MIKGYNIVVEASEEVATAARAVSQLLAMVRETGFTLDTTKHVPHVTLYHVSFEEDRLDEVLEKLKQITSQTEAFRLHQTEYSFTHGRWVDIGYEREGSILKLHYAVTEGTAPFHAREEGANQREEWSDASPERQENLELYGASEIRSLYRPHLTLTRFQNLEEESVLDTLPKVDFSFTATTVALYELGKYGTCHSVLGVFPLTHETL